MNSKSTTIALLSVLVVFLIAGLAFTLLMSGKVTDLTRQCYHDAPWEVMSRYDSESDSLREYTFELQCKTDKRIYTYYTAERPTWARIGDTLHFIPVFHNNSTSYEDQFKNR